MNALKHPLINLSFLTLLCVCSVSSYAGETLWSLDLSNHAEGPAPEIGKGLEVRVEDGMKMLHSPQSEKVHYVRFPSNFPPFSETRDWNDLIFQVRFRSDSATGLVLLMKKNGARNDVQYDWYYAQIFADGIQVRVHGLSKDASVNPEDPRVTNSIKFKDKGDPLLMRGKWVTVEAQIGEEVIKLTVTTEDGFTYAGEFPTFSGAGGVHLLALNPVDVAEISVRKADAPVKPSKEAVP